MHKSCTVVFGPKGVRIYHGEKARKASTLPGAVVDPDLKILEGIPTHFWKPSADGKSVLEMSKEEKENALHPEENSLHCWNDLPVENIKPGSAHLRAISTDFIPGDGIIRGDEAASKEEHVCKEVDLEPFRIAITQLQDKFDLLPKLSPDLSPVWEGIGSLEESINEINEKLQTLGEELDLVGYSDDHMNPLQVMINFLLGFAVVAAIVMRFL